MFSSRNSNQSHYQHHHIPNQHHKVGAMSSGDAGVISPESALAGDIFEQFVSASTFKSVLHFYRQMCDVLRLRPQNIRHFYPKLRSKIRSWRAQAIWSKFDKRMSHRCYNHGKACLNTKVLIIGAGPCGLRSAIEAQMLGAKVVVVEKRDRFSRNNVLHLWPFVIADLKGLGAKKFYGKFCAGSIDHISIRQLQCMLLKAALLLGVEVFEGVAFEELLPPPDDQSQCIGWHARFSPAEHPVNQYEFDVLIGADGKRNTLQGFRRKEFRGKLAIAITANFINKHTELEARVQEISGVAFIFNQKFFKDLYAETGIDLENIVYYKDDTHYFVMTAKKHSLIDKGVILRDLPDTQQLLHPNNVDRKALCDYAREAADFSTGYQLPHMDFAVNHYGKPDIAMFDFTSMFAAENACRVVQKNGHKILQCLVGDSLLEPFWPTGSGCARGFLSSFDACWAIRSWSSSQMSPLEVVAERESIYRLLAQTTPENLNKDYSAYTVLPTSRYPTVNVRAVLPFQVRHLFITDEPLDEADDDGSLPNGIPLQKSMSAGDIPRKRKRKDSLIQVDALLAWCQKQIGCGEEDPKIEDLSSFKDGRVLCTILHKYRPDVIDLDNLADVTDAERCQVAFDILEKEFGIQPVISGLEMSEASGEERLIIISYISQVHDALRGEIPHSLGPRPPLKSFKSQMDEAVDLEDFPNIHLTGEDQNMKENQAPSLNGRVACKIVDVTLMRKDEAHKKKRRSLSGSVDKLDQDRGQPKANDVRHSSSLRAEKTEEFSDLVKGLEAKFKGEQAPPSAGAPRKPKDLGRSVGKLEKTDWNLSAIERKIEENTKTSVALDGREKVPRWSKDTYNDKFKNIERRLRENGENEERIAKYLDIDASLQRLERKLREGSTLDTGLRGHNKVSNLASQLSSKLTRKPESEAASQAKASVEAGKQTRPMVIQASSSDLCYFCGTKVYLVEKLVAEGKFFHRQCFKCSFCAALLRPGNYIYDRENRYGGKFFCVPHFGLTAKSRGPRRNEAGLGTDPSLLGPDRPTSKCAKPQDQPGADKGNRTPTEGRLTSPKRPSAVSLPLEDRGATPERVEFENSLVEESDEEEYLSEDEWTDRNFGASANELDDEDDESDYSDLSDEEEAEDELLAEAPQKMTEAETRRLAETWKQRYSLDGVSGNPDLELYSDSDGSEHGAEGDESLIPTEGEFLDEDDDDEDDNEDVKRARELRRQELNINFSAPPRMGETSDSESDTEVGTSDEESDTQIDTDSEFADDQEKTILPKDIPKIVINEMPKDDHGPQDRPKQEPKNSFPLPKYVLQEIDVSPNLGIEENQENPDQVVLSKPQVPNPHTEHLKRLLQRTESSEAFSAQKSLMKKEYLLGSSNTAPKKSASSVDLGNRFKSFMDKISETQKKLNPAPEPSPSMQAFLNLCNKDPSLEPAGNSLLTDRNRLNKISHSSSVVLPRLNPPVKSTEPNGAEDHRQSTEENTDNSSVMSDEEGKLITFARSSEDLAKNILDKKDDLRLKGTSDVPLANGITEKGALDSEQSEKDFTDDIFETEVDFEDELNDLEDIPVEALNVDLIACENLKNVSSEIRLVENFGADVKDESEDNVDEDFDLLAEDALNDLEDVMKSSNDKLKNESLVEKEKEEVIDSQSKSTPKSDSTGYKTQEESGFKSMEGSKISSDPNSRDPSTERTQTDAVSSTLKNNDPSNGDAGITDVDLSDWIEDSETLAEKFDRGSSEVKSSSGLTPVEDKGLSPMFMARMASQESLGDSDSAVSVGPKSSTVSLPKLAAFAETEDFEYMDSEENSLDDSHKDEISVGYSKLEGCLTTPDTDNSKCELITPVSEDKPLQELKRADFQAYKSRSEETEPTIREPETERSFSEPPTVTETTPTTSPGLRYEGYIPRFKEKMTPFSLVRDSIDVRKCSSPKPLFTPSIEDIREREKNERERLNALVYKESADSSLSSLTASPSPTQGKVGDLVKDMVMSRMTSKQSDRNRRGSRNAVQLSLRSSSSSLTGPESSASPSKKSLTSVEDVSPLCKDDSNVPSKETSTQFELKSNSSTPNLNLMNKTREGMDLNLSPRNVLPATPLTHPEKFKISTSKRELFMSTPQLHLSQMLSSPTHSPYSSPYDPKINTDAPFTGDQVEASPHSPYPRPRRMSESAIRRRGDERPPENLLALRKDEDKPKKDPDVRLRELLEERRRRGYDDAKDARRNKEFCLRECLEEYRQKRSSAPVYPLSQHHMIPSPSQNREGTSQTALNLGFARNQFPRPTLTDLEAMQIFSTASKVPLENRPIVPHHIHFTQESSSPIGESPGKSLSKSMPAVSPVSSAPSGFPEVTPVPEKKHVKKSKDRERRRSLIQVVAGMFSKTEEKKKDSSDIGSSPEGAAAVEASPSLSPPSSAPVSPPSTSTSPQAAKSPSVKERFSRLRLSRAKEKKKSTEAKNRSVSSGTPLPSSEGDCDKARPISMPTSPSRTIFSFLSSPSSRSSDRASKTSSSGPGNSSYFGQKFSPACIKEEKDSEDDSTIGCIGASSTKETPPTASIRRQKAALRAAKQAEQKRLRMAQEIQRQMEECEVKMRELEERGIGVEKSLTGETREGNGPRLDDDEPLLREWFSLVREKNALVRCQEELCVKARELELEDRHVRLEEELRQRMTSAEREKSREDIEREGKILAEIISIIEQKDALVTLLEEDRLRYAEEDEELEQLQHRKMASSGLGHTFERETGV